MRSLFAVTFFYILISHGQAFVSPRHSLLSPLTNEALENWYLSGSAALTKNHVELTPDEQNKEGAMWNVHPCMSADWEVQLQFQIHGKGRHLYGNGMAVWYVKEPLHQGPVFGSKDHFSGLGVFIDTFENPEEPHRHKHPYISAMINNGSLEYEHDEDGTYTQLGGCYAELRNLKRMTRIAVSYTEDSLTVFLDTEGKGKWTPCFKALGVYLPTGYYIGVSASTGDLSDNHQLMSLTTLEFVIPRMEEEDRSKIIPHAEHFQAPKEHKKLREEIEEIVVEPKLEEVVIVEEMKVEEVKKHEELKPKKKERLVEEEPSGSTSVFMKIIYVIGLVIILGITVNTCRKYFARRRESMEKRCPAHLCEVDDCLQISFCTGETTYMDSSLLSGESYYN